ncbi:MAG: 2-oxoacid:acceptor oxidoreductase family protein [Candidatus Bathyarchaeia archaeon]|nr:2-oxoacid:acceptor oxidoreductase family protein [Candidatus Bathyarchaeia archaeon]
MKKIEVRISGFGGQGVILAGQVLGKAAVYNGKNAVQTQSYGAEARGSAAKSEVIISDGKIDFPSVRKCDMLIAMSQTAVDKHLKDLKENGVLIVDSSMVKKIPETKAKFFKIQASEIAEKTFGEKLYANMIMLGALNKITKVVNENFMKKAIKDTVPKKAITVNMQAYKKGKELIE